tara:strand:- start:3727 stop:3948 length:222 start_codon:yes stop_codon:yes gene_type:complete
MVFGVIIYETIDIMYNLTSIGYKSAKGIYNWYYSIDDTMISERDQILLLEYKVDKLEKIIKQINKQNDSEKIV